LGTKHNKLSKYSKAVTTEYPSEQSTPYRNTYSPNNKVATNTRIAEYNSDKIGSFRILVWLNGCYD
jgi:hypothetical protein